MEEEAQISGDTSDQPPSSIQGNSLSNGLLIAIAIVGPTFLFAELWRGKPIIDQSGHWWLIPAFIMAAGFLIGASVAGQAEKSASAAIKQGASLASVTLVLTFLVDLVRRATLGQWISWAVIRLWVAAAAAALVVGGIGGLMGQWRVKNRQRTSL
jgi:ABC-type multidrug transport system permease subunit